MKNGLGVPDRDPIPFTATAAGVAGAGLLLGGMFGIIGAAVQTGERGVLYRRGQFNMPKLSGDVMTVGAVVYWDDTNKWLTLTASSNVRVGYVRDAAGNGVLTVNAVLVGA